MLLVAAVMLLAACAAPQQQGDRLSSYGTTPDVENCVRTEQEGCFEFDILIVENSSDAEVEHIKSMRSSRIDGAAELLYQAAKEGRTQLHDGCVPATVRFWGYREVPHELMREYSFESGRHVSAPLDGRSADPLHPSYATKESGPSLAYDLTVCGGKGAFQVPWEFMPPRSYVQIEIKAKTLFPESGNDDHCSIWVYNDHLDEFRDSKKTWALVAVIMA
jgi:hypothetical protein